jgi:hypothetical protein
MSVIKFLYQDKRPLNKSISISMALQLFRPWLLFQFLNLYRVGRTPWTGDQPVARPLPTHRTTKNRINAHRHPCLEWDSNPPSQRSSGQRQFSSIQNRKIATFWSWFRNQYAVFRKQPFSTMIKMDLAYSSYRVSLLLPSQFPVGAGCLYWPLLDAHDAICDTSERRTCVVSSGQHFCFIFGTPRVPFSAWRPAILPDREYFLAFCSPPVQTERRHLKRDPNSFLTVTQNLLCRKCIAK